MNSKTVMGTMGFVGKEYSGQIVHVYSVIKFPCKGETIWFNGNDNIIFKPGEAVPVRYSANNPHNARIDCFTSVWGDTVVYGGLPALVILFAYIHPIIVPRKSKLVLSRKKPYLKLVRD